MTGETDLEALLQGMNPELHPETYVFVTRPGQGVPPDCVPVLMFQEREGTTFIVTQAQAEALGWSYEYPCCMITLNVHSALDAIGFLARIFTALANAGVSVNPVAGYHHDHLFVPEEAADAAMELLKQLSKA